ncbi:MAG: hypothetical protein NTZ12_04655 [Candidatus Aminicenantes bacterium]|nr:hypothetical protein [Candidatus Aminicenantes bacterium]
MDEANGEIKVKKSTSLLTITMRKSFNFLGFAGVIFIFYGMISRITGSSWPVLEKWVPPVSAFLTIVATLITAIAIYFYDPHPYPPEKFSKAISAPLVIIACIVALVYLIGTGDIQPVIVNGFALLGISGGLFRILKRTVE